MNLHIGNIGVWGFRHYEFLKQNRPSTVSVMRMNGTLEAKKRPFLWFCFIIKCGALKIAQFVFEIRSKALSIFFCNISSFT